MVEVNRILVAIRRITRAIDLHSKQLVKSAGLTVPQLLVMQAVHRGGKRAINHIAADVRLSQATVTSILDRLERSGLARRERDQQDRRQVSVCLTLEGQAKLETAPELMQRSFVREFGRLESWEQAMLVSSLERVAAMMDAEDLDASPILASGDMARQSEEDAVA